MVMYMNNVVNFVMHMGTFFGRQIRICRTCSNVLVVTRIFKRFALTIYIDLKVGMVVCMVWIVGKEADS